MFQLKRLNPVIQNEWKKDRERGPVYSQRVEEMRLIKLRFHSMTSEEQLKWINTINEVVEKESSPELRREAVLALGEVVERPEATGTIINLAKDRNDKVRLEVSKVLKKYPSPETTKTLLALAAADTSQSVRLAATESLGTHRSDEVKQFLSKQLNDRSPAMQYHASLALKDFTGKDFKGDVSLWKRYLAGEEVEPPTVSLAESMQSYIPFLR
jgi:HEAT repeat protein